MCMGKTGRVDLRGKMTLDTSPPHSVQTHGSSEVPCPKGTTYTPEGVLGQVICEAAARGPAGRSQVVMVMGVDYVGGSGVFQRSTADTSVGVFLKTRNVQLESHW